MIADRGSIPPDDFDALAELFIGGPNAERGASTAPARGAGAVATATRASTPVVSVPPDVSGVRIVVASGQRVDLVWTVPATAGAAGTPWIVGCHIPGHFARGMQIPIHWVAGGAAGSGPGTG